MMKVMNKENDEVMLRLPSEKEIPCLNCKYGCLDYLSIRCPMFPKCKPYNVYYENGECPKKEEIVK